MTFDQARTQELFVEFQEGLSGYLVDTLTPKLSVPREEKSGLVTYALTYALIDHAVKISLTMVGPEKAVAHLSNMINERLKALV